MPLHDWSKVPAGLFHHFHQAWSIAITQALNGGLLPRGLSALVEQRASGFEPDVLAIEEFGGASRGSQEPLTGAVTMARPETRFVYQTDPEFYAAKANRIAIKHNLGRTIAVIEIVSPGNKDRRSSVRDFVEKSVDFLQAGIHLLIIDLFPPSPRDPHGLHKLIWDDFAADQEFSFPAGKDRLLASYETGSHHAAYVETIGVGDRLPEMALFLANEWYVPVPLESTYVATWDTCPEVLRTAVETGVMPYPAAE